MREWQITQSSNDCPLSPIHLGMLYPFAYSQDLLSGIPSLMGARAGEIGMKECNEWLVGIEGLFDQFECHRRCTFQLGHDYYLVALHYRSMCMCVYVHCLLPTTIGIVYSTFTEWNERPRRRNKRASKQRHYYAGATPTP